MTIVVTSCSARLIDFTVISSKNLSLDGLPRAAERVTGTSCVPVVLFPIGQPDLKDAVDRAIESAGSPYNALADGVMLYQDKSFILGKVCFQVSGTPVTVVSEGSGSAESAREDNVVLHSSHGIPEDYSRLRQLSDSDVP